MSNEEQIEIKLSKGKLTLMLIGSMLFVAAGVWFIINPAKFKGTFTPNSSIIFVIGLAGVLVFGLLGVFIFKKLIDGTPGLIINKEGIIDNSSYVSAGQILWSDIVEIIPTKAANQDFLTIIVYDPELYISRQSSAIKRKAMKMSFRMYGSPISISANGLQCNFQELKNILHGKFWEFKSKKQGL